MKFELDVDRVGDQYEARCGGDLGQSRAAVSVPVLRSLAARASKLEFQSWNDAVAADLIGRELFGAVFPGEVGVLFRRAVEKARAQAKPLQVQLRYEPCRELHALPWELLHDGDALLALRSDVLLARYVKQPRSVRGLPAGQRLQWLLSLACPDDQEQIALDREREEVARWNRRHPDLVRLVTDPKARFDRVASLLRRHEEDLKSPFHVWHHCGHGGYPRGSPEFHLVFDDGEGKSQFVPASELARMVAKAPSLKLVFLNVCHAGDPAGLATYLAGLNVPAVIGFRTAVQDHLALTFSRTLYEQLLRHPIDWAVREARRELGATGEPLAWALPILFLRATDARLWSAPKPPETAARGADRS